MPVEDYRERVGHLIEAIHEVGRAVRLLGQRMPDKEDEGIAEKINDFLKSADEELATAGWEL